jgi:PAS domain S-box-containing protein
MEQDHSSKPGEEALLARVRELEAALTDAQRRERSADRDGPLGIGLDDMQQLLALLDSDTEASVTNGAVTGGSLPASTGEYRGPNHKRGEVMERREVRERRREEVQRHRENLELMRAAIEGTDDPIAIKDLNGRYRIANTAAAAFVGVSPEHLEGKRDRDIFPADVAAAIEGVDTEVIADGKRRTVEERLPRADGELRIMSTTRGPYRDLGGQQLGIFVIAHDITERRRAEDALRELNASLEQRVAARTAEVEQQAEELRRMTAELSASEQRERRRLAQALHDGVQQLLVAARMAIEQAEQRVTDEVGARTILQRAMALIDESAEASRALSLELCPPVLYDRGLGPALAWLADHFREHHRLEISARIGRTPEPTNPDVEAFLFQAARELLLNVVKYARTTEAALMMTVNTDMLAITVEDNGIGFDPGQRLTEATAKGGFGLLNLRERLQLLGGRLDLHAAPGAGCRVTMSLPVSAIQPLEFGGTAASTPQAHVTDAGPGDKTDGKASRSGRPIRVMLVDDHRIVRDGLAGILQEQPGIQVVAEAADGREAIELVDRAAPDVIVMDVSMPRMDGVEATERILRERPHIRVIGLSMHEKKDLAEAMLRAGAIRYLTKGGPSNELITAIREARSPSGAA